MADVIVAHYASKTWEGSSWILILSALFYPHGARVLVSYFTAALCRVRHAAVPTFMFWAIPGKQPVRAKKRTIRMRIHRRACPGEATPTPSCCCTHTTSIVVLHRLAGWWARGHAFVRVRLRLRRMLREPCRTHFLLWVEAGHAQRRLQSLPRAHPRRASNARCCARQGRAVGRRQRA